MTTREHSGVRLGQRPRARFSKIGKLLLATRIYDMHRTVVALPVTRKPQ